MRDSFGGVFMINLFLVFIVIYVAFTAVSLNYAKAFRLKNQVIDFLEINEITKLEVLKEKYTDELSNILSASSYYKECAETETKDDAGNIISYCYNGVIIKKTKTKKISGTDASIIKYQVTTFADWDIGVLNKILALGGQSENSQEYQIGMWAINGEAQIVSKSVK